MPVNNNQKVQNAVTRLAKLPVVHSACTRLAVLYGEAKCSHPNLRSVCEGLESSVTAVVSPVIVRLEPQISIANDVACRSLDWLESTFPVLHTPTEEIVATAKDKMQEVQDVVSILANGTVDCVQHTVTWLMGRIQQADAIRVASVGLDSALIMSEALMDQVLPPTEEDEEEAAHLLEGFEVTTVRRCYPARLVSLAAKLCRRIKIQYVQIMENLSKSSGLVLDLQTLSWSIQALPQYVQHQLVSVLFFISQMYNLSCPPPQHHQSNQDGGHLSAAESSAHKDVVQVNPIPTPPKPVWRKRLINASVFDKGCDVKGCVNR